VTSQHIQRLILVGTVLLLSLLFFFISKWILLPALLVGLILGAVVFAGEATKAKTTSLPVSQPPAEPEQPPTAQTSYTQGYRAQPSSAHSSASFPFTPTSAEPQPHQDRPGDAIYEHPLVQYPEQ
jgi:hypothetical protein